jgi:hypothetical protein
VEVSYLTVWSCPRQEKVNLHFFPGGLGGSDPLVLRVRIHESFWAFLFLVVCFFSLFAVLVVFLGLDTAARGEQQEVVTTTRSVPSISYLTLLWKIWTGIIPTCQLQQEQHRLFSSTPAWKVWIQAPVAWHPPGSMKLRSPQYPCKVIHPPSLDLPHNLFQCSRAFLAFGLLFLF